ncbi:MAG: methyltransferase [Lysobacter sp.]|nr:MAG: methyltransferase [Lysobacter sp.]
MRLVPSVAVFLLAGSLSGCASRPAGNAQLPSPAEATLDAAIAGPWRAPANTARDVYRHPKETLGFFGLTPTQTVVEITPSPGWYSEILAPYLRARGHYVAAVIDPVTQKAGAGRDYYAKARETLQAKFSADPARYGGARLVSFDPGRPVFGAPASADLVLTFRNVHNWRLVGTVGPMFKGFFDVLRPGGVLGVVEHRANGDVADDDRSGYVGEAQVIVAAQAAGFVLDGSSDINANPRDTKDHPNGVWTLPPTNQHEATDDAKYRAIGESDRMTLRFVKPRG